MQLFAVRRQHPQRDRAGKDQRQPLLPDGWKVGGRGAFPEKRPLKVSVVDLIYRAFHKLGIEPPSEKEL